MSVGPAYPSGAASGTERARPRSGVWALLTRLRRPASSDSLSSAGSDATISFSFLSHPPPSNDPLSPFVPTPLTDSYKKRVRDRNVRRQHDRDLTLHRKYGLIRGDATYDAFSLPNARRSLLEPLQVVIRDRRATSESLPRCAAHVPGKRRAPLPPRTQSLLVTTSSLTRRHSRKRPAPQPPINTLNTTKDNRNDTEKENVDININSLVKMRSNKSDRVKRPMLNDKADQEKRVSNGETLSKLKADKNTKKDSNVQVPKMKREKSFLQQIFEGRKRSSAIGPPPERILPNISELDKQAAEIIETFRLKPLEHSNRDTATANNGDAWFCTKCLRKYNSTVVTCLYCLPEHNKFKHQIITDKLKNIANSTNVTKYTQIDSNPSCGPSTSHGNGIAMDEKERLKEMLKEIKDSLTLRSEHGKKEPRSEERKNIALSKRKSPMKNVEPKGNSRDDEGIYEDIDTYNKRDSYYDPVTLRIGSTADEEYRTAESADPQPSTSRQHVIATQSTPAATNREFRLVRVGTEPVKETVVVTQPVVLVGPQPKNHKDPLRNNSKSCEKRQKTEADFSKISLSNDLKFQKINQLENAEGPKKERDASSGPANPYPITISSLLNHFYVPQQSSNQDLRRSFFSQSETQNSDFKSKEPTKSISGLKSKDPTNSNVKPTTMLKPLSSSLSESVATSTTSSEPKLIQEINKQPEHPRPTDLQSRTPINKIKDNTPVQNAASSPKLTLSSVSTSTFNTPLSEKAKIINANMVRMSVDQHSKRREWVSQLEQSIAKGDELAAAQAAAKLAQLRVACSVLSFSSQIVGESSNNSTQTNVSKAQNTASAEINVNRSKPSEPVRKTKVNVAVQSMEVVTPKGNTKNSSNKEDATPASNGNDIIPKTVPAECKPDSSKSIRVADNVHSAPSTSGQNTGIGSTLVSINVWVEDRESTRGPVRLWVPRGAALGELRRRAEDALGLRAPLQRWIIGHALCSDDVTPLTTLAGPELNKPFYLCLVEDTGTESPDLKTKPTEASNSEARALATTDVYSELVQLEQQALVPNAESFECGVCMELCAAGEGAVLRECVHAFCRACLADVVRHCDDAAVTCPALGCPATLQEREIRAVAPQPAYERWLALGLAAAESGARHAFHCRTSDCAGWALCEPGVRHFPCPVCHRNNCVPCQAIHEGETCDEHRTKLQTAATSLAGDTDEGTRALLDELIFKGEALECPECNAIITKKWGCDWVKCSACKTEICWVTRGRRWGPGGRGDTSAGCRCGVDGKRCHPTCGYCH